MPICLPARHGKASATALPSLTFDPCCCCCCYLHCISSIWKLGTAPYLSIICLSATTFDIYLYKTYETCSLIISFRLIEKAPMVLTDDRPTEWQQWPVPATTLLLRLAEQLSVASISEEIIQKLLLSLAQESGGDDRPSPALLLVVVR